MGDIKQVCSLSGLSIFLTHASSSKIVHFRAVVTMEH